MTVIQRPVILPEPLPTGKEGVVFTQVETTAGSKVAGFTLDAESILLGLYVSSISGTLDINVYTSHGDSFDKKFLTASFPTISAASGSLVLKKAATVMGTVLIEATWSDAVTFELRARGVGTAEASVKILGATSARARQQDIATSATLVVPAALSDRSGLVLQNNSSTQNMYIGFTAAESAPLNGYIIYPRGQLGLDLDAGVEVYARSDSGSADMRILEAGG